jgi:exonuclease V
MSAMTDEESSNSASPVLDAPEVQSPPAPEESVIIGTMEFPLDEQFLNSYVADVLRWWHGRRPPKGVEVELSRRCL